MDLIVTDMQSYEHGKWIRQNDLMIIETKSPYDIHNFPRGYPYDYSTLKYLAKNESNGNDCISIKVIGWASKVIIPQKETLNIEYNGNVVKINKSGHYKVSTVGGKLVIEEIDNEKK